MRACRRSLFTRRGSGGRGSNLGPDLLEKLAVNKGVGVALVFFGVRLLRNE